MCSSCDAYSSVQGGESVCVKSKCVGAERVAGVGAHQVARFRRVMEGQRLESKAGLVAGHDEEIAPACKNGQNGESQPTPRAGLGNQLPRLLQIHRDEPVLEGMVSNRQCISVTMTQQVTSSITR